MKTLKYTLVSFLFLLIGVMFLVVGCAQGTAVPIVQDTGQETITPTTTDQDAATQGSQVNVWVINAPGRGGLSDPAPISLGGDSGISMLVDKVANADGATIEGTDAGYAQSGINITINTGSTTPGQSGTTTATASVAQTPSAYPTVSPIQDIKPETSASVPIGVALPGGMVDQQAIATGKGQTADTSKTSENDQRWAKIEATADKLEHLLPLLEQLLGVKSETDGKPVEDGNSGPGG